ncbi:diguanylate cyclase domain-containing protein [Massilia niabensis]|uniref:Diguanylate cyclase domain-containing protein n=1 Tax=Massilia niabensis TaxID=544910 RepID=A0ABW0L0J7_9BURK
MTDTPAAPRLFRLTTFTMFAVGAAVALTVLLHLVLVGHFAEKQGQREAELRVQQLSWQMRDSLNRVVASAVEDVQLLAELPQVRSFADADASRGVLESLQRSFPDYAWIGIANREGTVMAATGRMLEGVNARERPWFAAGSQGLRATDYHPALLLNKVLPKTADPWRFVDVAAPLKDETGAVRGVVAVHMSWEWARRRARELLTPALREYGAEVLVVRADGTVLLGPAALVEGRIDLPSLRLAQRGESGALREQGPDGKTYITGYSRTGAAGNPATLQWAVLVRHTEEAAMAGVRQLERRMIVLSALMAAILAGCAALLARRLTRPMDALSRAIEGAAQAGERGLAVGQGVDIPVVNGFHEVQVLSRAMRELVRSEQGHRLALETMNQQLESTVAARTAELQALLRRDTLTGLPNRRALMEMLPEALHRAARSRQCCALLFLDLDGFKGVNDTHGHEQGDELLRQFSTRLVSALRKTDTAARLGGDEFVVVLEGLNDAGDARHKAAQLLPLLDAPYALAQARVSVGASIGIALHMPDDSHDTERWMVRADGAMYAAKRGGKGTIALAPVVTKAG